MRRRPASYAAAQRIVAKNIEAVEAWRSYVLDQLSPGQLGAQVFGTGFEQVQQQAAANGAEHLLGAYASELRSAVQYWRGCCRLREWARAERTPRRVVGELQIQRASAPRCADGDTFRAC